MYRLSLAALALVTVAAAPPRERVLVPHAVLKGHSEEPQDAVFSPDGKLLAVCANREPMRGERPNFRTKRWGEIKLWEVKAGKVKSTLVVDEAQPTGLAFTSDGKKLFCVTEEGHRIRWDVASGKKDQVFSPKKGAWRDVKTGVEIARDKWKSDGHCQLSHDLRLVAVANYQDVDLRDARTGKLVRSLMDHPGSVQSLSFSGDDRLLAVSYVYRKDDESRMSVCLWDVRRGKQLRTIQLDGLDYATVELSPTGGLLAISGWTSDHGTAEVRLYEAAIGGELARLQPIPAGERAWVKQFSPDGRFLALGCTDRSVRLYEVRLPRKAR